ncbi:hypothetical protein WICMUC_000463 [Wickerhamomyces mucosus]|uniref:TOG domain-containing protein n=1 Tax=Wickerhamomyces mucosus TaxID=1378264 RepID=A0A9P8PXL5_9ASCO|nr:hypothetical protein WICMUC_000463 [Wickerhamomyces mucosus]
MSEEPDYSKLPLDERLVHKVWKVRLEAYQEITNNFQKSPNEESEVFKPYLQTPDLFKKIVTDSNVVAQESGIVALNAFLEFGGTKGAVKLRSHVVPGLCEKGLSSSRAGTKQKTIESLLWIIELDTPDPVIELMIPSLSARLPKLVSGTVKALGDIYTIFGAKTVSPKLVLPSLSKLFSHADKNVRAETSNLTVILYKWMGPALEQILFPELKPVQQKDLTAAFEKVKDEKPSQARYLKSQQELMKQVNEAAGAGGAGGDENGDVVMGNAEEASNNLDPYDLIDPIEVLSKISPNLSVKVSVPKWKERVEALTEVEEILKPVIKLTDSDYTDLVRVLAKCLKDVNIQVVSLASNCIEYIAKGLRARFHRYYNIVLNPLLERTKEKKQSVLDALNGALDSVFQNTSLSDILDETLVALKHKTPQVRLATSQFLARCLKETTVAPNKSELESIMTAALKLVSDTLSDIRNSAFQIVGILMKIRGERELNSYLESIDDIKKNKIKEAFESAEVKAKVSNARPKPAVSSSAKTQLITRASSSISSNTSLKGKSATSKSNGLTSSSSSTNSSSSSSTTLPIKKKQGLLSSNSTIPSKRGPTSPLKTDTSSRIGTLGNRGGLTGRTLQSNSLQPPSLALKDNGLNEAEKTELEDLRREKLEWLKEKEKINWQLQESMTESSRLMKEVQVISAKLEKLNDQHTENIMNIKSRDTQLQRAQSDLEISKLKISQLESEIELIQKQKSTSLFSSSLSHHHSDYNTKFTPLQESNILRKERFVSPNASSHLDQLDQRVSTLTIDNEQKENTTRPVLDTNDESWRRAAEVTSQLKARIEKMKARTRNSSFRNDSTTNV